MFLKKIHNFFHTQKFLQIISQKIAQIFLTQKFAQITEQKSNQEWSSKKLRPVAQNSGHVARSPEVSKQFWQAKDLLKYTYFLCFWNFFILKQHFFSLTSSL